MEYEQKQFFKENEYDDVKGFTVLDASDGKYHIAEKWLDADHDEWMDYWVPEGDLLARVESGDCEPTAMLTAEQFEAVCKKAGRRYDAGEMVEA